MLCSSSKMPILFCPRLLPCDHIATDLFLSHFAHRCLDIYRMETPVRTTCATFGPGCLDDMWQQDVGVGIIGFDYGIRRNMSSYTLKVAQLSVVYRAGVDNG